MPRKIPIPSDKSEWLEQRRSYMGASDTPVAMGVSPWGSPWNLWAEKVGRLPQRHFTNRPIQFGQHLEPLLIKMASEELGIAIMQPNETWLDDEHPCIAASLDGISECGGIVVEAKAGNVYDKDDWDRLEGGEIPNIHTKVGGYYCQIQQQMMVAQASLGYFTVSLNNQHLLARVEPDPALQLMLREFIVEWWQRHIVEGVEPEAVDKDLYKLALLDYDKDIEVDLSEHSGLLDLYVEGSTQEKEGKAKKQEALARMRQLAGDAGRISFTIEHGNGHASVRRGGMVPGRVLFDEAAFKKAHPDLYKEFKTKQSDPYFTLFRGGGKR